MTFIQSFGLVMWYVVVSLPFLTLAMLFIWGMLRTFSVVEEGRCAEDFVFRLWTGIAMAFWSGVILISLFVWWTSSGVDLSSYSAWRNSINKVPAPAQVEDAR